VVFGAGAGLMNVPLTNVVLHSMPPEQSGVASALLNASREIAGLLGITIIGAVLRSRQGAALHHGTSQSGSFLDGYHAGLALTVALIAAGAVLSYVTLRRASDPAAGPAAGSPEQGPVRAAEDAVAAELSGIAGASGIDPVSAITVLGDAGPVAGPLTQTAELTRAWRDDA
jgi:hypothetical protein